MRDIFLVAFLLFAVFYTFKKPYIGVAAWIWIALTGPTEWAFGFSQTFRLNLTIVLVTALAYLFYRDKYKVNFSSVHFWVFLFWFWTLLATFLHDQINTDYVWIKMNEFTKVIVLYLFIVLTVRKKHELDTLIWAIVLSVSAYGAMEAVKFLLSGGGHRITGKVGILKDRNDLAVAINMCIPLIIYLLTQTKHKYLKLGLVGIIVLNAIAIVGTYSRGGFVGLAILGVAFWLKSNHKILIAVVAIMLLPVAYNYAPAEWKERQQTVETAAVEDSSFIGRLWAWKVATMIALDDPLTGGGMKANIDPLLWQTYAPYTSDFGPIYTPPVPEYLKPLAAHNIYFQVLGSSGFAGLIIFLFMLWSGFWRCWRMSVSKVESLPTWKKDLTKAISLTFIGYGVTGLNVSLAYFELVYALLAIIAVITFTDLARDDRNVVKA
jgi:probable O-glycosylation ligase (exosortase A-associated)